MPEVKIDFASGRRFFGLQGDIIAQRLQTTPETAL
jgi:hypothetical protein